LIIIGAVISLLVFLYGIKIISTNYDIQENFPRGARITNDFQYFEDEFAGFRPLEFSIKPLSGYSVNDYEVIKEVSKLSDYLLSYEIIKSSISLATFYKSINRMNSGNTQSAYLFPNTEKDFLQAQQLIKRSRMAEEAVLISKDKSKTRISARMADIGADSIKEYGIQIDAWIADNIDGGIVEVERTGTGMILVKNADYIRNNILFGLVIAIIAVSILMGLLFKSWIMVLIALIPNIFPLLMAGAIIGYSGIELEAGVSVVFAIVFGIAVDDTIHFLSKFKLTRNTGLNIEDSLKITYEETGKAILFTTIILFFGFLLMLFSSNPPSITVGILISFTLVGALICDLTLLPLLIRKLIKE
jgi:predicted RND superfamily exporter protein